MPNATQSQPSKLLDEVRKVLRLHHYSIHTERSYVEWVIRFVRFHGMRSREDLFPAEPKIEAFLTDLVVNGNVAPATQNQAMNALVFPTSASSILLCRAVSMPFAPTRRSTSPLS
jgi:hypothetical protein